MNSCNVRTRRPLTALPTAVWGAFVGCLLAAPTISAQEAAPGAVAAAGIAVLPLRVSDLQVNDAKRLDRFVREAVQSKAKFAIQSEEMTTSLVDSAMSLGLDCEINSLDCAVSLGELADVGFVMLGQAVGIEDQIGLEIAVIDVAARRQLYRGTRLVPTDVDAQGPAVRGLVLALFAESARATLAITSTPAGARIFLNGQDRGVTPAEKLEGLIPGEHHLRIELDKFQVHEEKLTLQLGEHVVRDIGLIPLTLDRAPRTPVELALPFGVAAGGVAMLAAGAVAVAFGVEPLLAYNAAKEAHTQALEDPAPNAQTLFEQREILAERSGQLNTWAFATLVTGGVAAAAGTAIAIGGAIWGGLVVVDEYFVE